MEAKQPSFSILMFPWLAHGHVFPYLELAKHLCNHNFTIFFCSTPINLKSVYDSLQSTSDHLLPIKLIELHLPSSPELPPELHTTKNAPPHLMPALQSAFHASKSSFSATLAALNPNMLIFDGLQPWAADAAAALNIPALHFATTGAATYSFFYHHLTHKGAPFPYHDAVYLRPHEWRALQAVGAKLEKDGYDRRRDEGGMMPQFDLSRDVVLMKTSRAVEGKYVDYLSILCNRKIVPTGPLITTTMTTTTVIDSDIMDWLSKKERFSTIYISLGSENYLSKNEMEEMAKGLEASNVNFIWVVRSPQGEKKEELPLGFVERVGERGKIVEGWAPQAEILGHENICGFISHCGMSSTIESVYFGVPVIGIPMKLDQPLNCRLLVEAGVGVEVVRDENGGFGGDDVAVAIQRVVGGGEEMRARAAEMRAAMKGEEEGLVEEVAEHLRRICEECLIGGVTSA